MMLDIKDPENFGHLKEKINENIDFNIDQYTDTFLSRRFEVRIRANNLNSYSDYLKVFLNSPEEKEKLNKELAIHVTNFLRDASMWSFFQEKVIPDLIKKKNEKGNKKIRIWSAGCSTGEEPLSIAICFFEALGNDLRGFEIEILGTDVDAKTIERAKEAKYEEIQFREMGPELKKKYFDDIGEGLLIPKDDIRKLTEYRVLDLFSPNKPSNFDIIFCRNTVIYFNLEAKSRLYEEFFHLLNDYGFFIMGKTEIMQGKAREMFKIFDSKERIYHKE